MRSVAPSWWSNWPPRRPRPAQRPASSSGGGIRTRNPSVNSRMLCLIELPRTVLRCRATRERAASHRTVATRQFPDSALDLCVTRRAKQNALARLSTQLMQSPGHATKREGESLGPRIHMMKLKGPQVAVLAADRAATSSLGDQHSFHSARRRRFTTAPVAAIRSPDEEGLAVSRTAKDRLRRSTSVLRLSHREGPSLPQMSLQAKLRRAVRRP